MLGSVAHARIVAAVSCVALLACTQHPDVVAKYVALAPVTPKADAGDAASGSLDRCSPTARDQSLGIPADVALDLALDCTVPLASLSRPDGGGFGITAEEFAKLVPAKILIPTAGNSSELLCDPTAGGLYKDPAINPKRFVLCPATCDLVKASIKLARQHDGCDGPFDAALPPGFPTGLPSGFQPGGPSDASVNDDGATH